jgi:hypothetical protein
VFSAFSLAATFSPSTIWLLIFAATRSPFARARGNLDIAIRDTAPAASGHTGRMSPATGNGRFSENSANDMCQPKNGTRIQDGTSIKVSFVIRTGARRQAARRIVIVGPCRVRSGTESVDPIATPDPRINRFHDDMPYHSRVTLKARLTLRRCTLRGETAKARYETDQDEAFPGHLAILAGSMTFPRHSHEYHMTRP